MSGKTKLTLWITESVKEEAKRVLPEKKMSQTVEKFLVNIIAHKQFAEEEMVLESYQIERDNFAAQRDKLKDRIADLEEDVRHYDGIITRHDAMIKTLSIVRDDNKYKHVRSETNRLFARFMIDNDFKEKALSETEKGQELLKMMEDLELITSPEQLQQRIKLARIYKETKSI